MVTITFISLLGLIFNTCIVYMNSYSFSVANSINISVDSDVESHAIDFIKKIYSDFDSLIQDPLWNINIRLSTESCIKLDASHKLGKDAIYNSNSIKFSSGHLFSVVDNTINVTIPQKIKRGRVPFKRLTPGRHVSDEIIEPLLKFILPELSMSFLHASAYLDNNTAVITMGWRGTGKTMGILSHIKSHKILADDLVIIDTQGYAYPYPRPIRIYSYNISSLPYGKFEKLKYFIKSLLTPHWQPVEYIHYYNSSDTKFPISKIDYLNDENCSNLPLVSRLITDYEYSYFDNVMLMMHVAGVIHLESFVKKNTIFPNIK